MKLIPLYDRVVLLPKKVEELKSGIILPNAKEENSSIGTVVCVGDGQTFNGGKVCMQVKVNDEVLYSKFAGSTFKIEDKNYVIIRQADILSVLKGENDG